jgi:type I restriction enzyme S subunit
MIFNSSKFNSHWQDKRLADLGTFKRGKSRHRPRNDPKLFENGTYPLVQTGEVKEANLYISKHEATYNEFGLAQSQLWQENTLCITIAANIAETALLGYPMCFPDSVVGFNAYTEKSSELFMHYVFTYIRKAIQNSASGSIQDNINIEYLTALKFKIPKKDYQDKIVSVLSTLDKKIELNNRINAEFEAMAKTLYDYWFVQFDFPFDFAQGKPAANGKPYKAFGGKMVYNPTLKREIPEGWGAESLSSITSVSTESVNPADFPEKQFRHFSIPIFDATKTYAIESGNSIGSAKFIAKGTDLLVSKLNPWFNRVVYAMNEEDQICSTEFVVWRCSNSEIKNFLYLIATSQQFISHCTQSATGTSNSHKRVNPTVMMRFSVPFKREIAELYGEKIEPIIKQLIVNQRENTKLAELRDWLLPMLMNGQVSVK